MAHYLDPMAQYDKWKIDLLSAQSMLDDAEEKGKIEGKIEIALKALEMGMSIDDASKLTSLSKQQIEELGLTKQ